VSFFKPFPHLPKPLFLNAINQLTLAMGGGRVFDIATFFWGLFVVSAHEQ
jgi:hypothetical protein